MKEFDDILGKDEPTDKWQDIYESIKSDQKWIQPKARYNADQKQWEVKHYVMDKEKLNEQIESMKEKIEETNRQMKELTI